MSEENVEKVFIVKEKYRHLLAQAFHYYVDRELNSIWMDLFRVHPESAKKVQALSNGCLRVATDLNPYSHAQGKFIYPSDTSQEGDFELRGIYILTAYFAVFETVTKVQELMKKFIHSPFRDISSALVDLRNGLYPLLEELAVRTNAGSEVQ